MRGRVLGTPTGKEAPGTFFKLRIVGVFRERIMARPGPGPFGNDNVACIFFLTSQKTD